MFKGHERFDTYINFSVIIGMLVDYVFRLTQFIEVSYCVDRGSTLFLKIISFYFNKTKFLVKFWLKSNLIILRRGFLILVFLDVVIISLFMREYSLYIRWKRLIINELLIKSLFKNVFLTLNDITFHLIVFQVYTGKNVSNL